MKKLLKLSSLCSFLIMAAMAALAEPLIMTLIGEKWLSSVPYLKCFFIIGALYPIHGMNLNLLMAHGRADLFLRVEVVKKALIIMNILVTYQFGVQVIIFGMVITSFVGWIINSYYTKKIIGYGLYHQIQDIFGNAASAIVLFIVLSIVQQPLNLPSLQVVICGAILSGLFCVILCRFLSRDIAEEFYTLISNYIPRAKPVARFILNL